MIIILSMDYHLIQPIGAWFGIKHAPSCSVSVPHTAYSLVLCTVLYWFTTGWSVLCSPTELEQQRRIQCQGLGQNLLHETQPWRLQNHQQWVHYNTKVNYILQANRWARTTVWMMCFKQLKHNFRPSCDIKEDWVLAVKFWLRYDTLPKYLDTDTVEMCYFQY